MQGSILGPVLLVDVSVSFEKVLDDFWVVVCTGHVQGTVARSVTVADGHFSLFNTLDHSVKVALSR